MRRKFGISLILVAALPLAVASTAWACGVLASLKLDTTVATPGQSVTATGNNYYGSTPVSIHLMTRGGAVVATTPAVASKINTTFPIPATVSPGWYVVIATQYKADGVTPVVGTPGRTSLRIQGAGGAARAARRRAGVVSPWSSSKPTGPAGAVPVAHDGGGSDNPALLPMLLALVLSLALLGSGLSLTGRRNRSANGPQLGL